MTSLFMFGFADAICSMCTRLEAKELAIECGRTPLAAAREGIYTKKMLTADADAVFWRRAAAN